VIICLGLNLTRIRPNGDTFYGDDESSGWVTVRRKQVLNLQVTVNVQEHGELEQKEHGSPSPTAGVMFLATATVAERGLMRNYQ
jgi:hypothetical protein